MTTGKIPDFKDDPMFPDTEPVVSGVSREDVPDIMPAVLNALKTCASGSYVLMFEAGDKDLDVNLMDFNKFMSSFTKFISERRGDTSH